MRERYTSSIRDLAIKVIREDFTLMSLMHEEELLPEQCSPGTYREVRMIRLVNHYLAAKGQLPLGEEPALHPVQLAKPKLKPAFAPNPHTKTGREEIKAFVLRCIKHKLLQPCTEPPRHWTCEQIARLKDPAYPQAGPPCPPSAPVGA